jgi:alpha-tubulin suppressor-like RCC1 family protein
MAHASPSKSKTFFRQISAGRAHTLVSSDDGVAFAFGEGALGQLGNVHHYQGKDTSDAALPSVVDLGRGGASGNGGPPRVVQVSAGDHHSACITADGTLYTWGLERSGRLGRGRFTNSGSPQVGAAAAAGAPGGNSAAHPSSTTKGVLITDGAFCVQPLAVHFFKRNRRTVQMVSCGADHTLCIDDLAVAYAWGLGNYGALGLGDTRSIYRPTQIVLGNKGKSHAKSTIKWTMVSAGAKHSIFLNDNGRVFSCGHGTNGRLGLGTQAGQLLPTNLIIRKHGVPIDPPRFRFISAGEAHSAIIDSKGRLYTFGSGAYGRLGHGVEEDCYEPKLVDSLQRMQLLQAECGLFHTVVISTGGNLFTFGAGGAGQLGHEPDSSTGLVENYTVPTQIFVRDNRRQRDADTYVRFIQVSAGAYHTVAVDGKGNVRSWGCGSRGRLGHPPLGAPGLAGSSSVSSSASNAGSTPASSSGDDGNNPQRRKAAQTGGLQLTPSKLSFDDFAKPRKIAALADIQVAGINLQSQDSEWLLLNRAIGISGNVAVSSSSLISALGATSKAIHMVSCGTCYSLQNICQWFFSFRVVCRRCC